MAHFVILRNEVTKNLIISITYEILHFIQNDKGRRVQKDISGILRNSLRVIL